MTDVLRLWSVTSLEKLALGTPPGLLNHIKKEIAGTGFDRYKILAQFVEDGDRDGAIKWMIDAQFAGLSRASARGTDLHVAAEKLALGETPEIKPEHQPFLDQFMRFLADHQPEYLMAEAPVYHLRYGYAGTCDGIIRVGGRDLLFDIKSTAHSKTSGRMRPPFDNHVLQITAYKYAELVGLMAERVETNRGRYYSFDPAKHTEPMPHTDGAVCLVVSPHDYELVPVRSNDEVFRAWLAVLEIARFKEETMKVAVGPAITPEAAGVAA